MQIGYIICFVHTISKTNIINLFLKKYNHIIDSISIAKLYKIAYEFNIKAVIKTILEKMIKFTILLILSTYLKFRY